MKTASLEISKKLFDAGTTLDTYFVWYGKNLNDRDKVEVHEKIMPKSLKGKLDIIPAPTADELGESMPEELIVRRKHYILTIEKGFGWMAFYGRDDDDALGGIYIKHSETMADALGLMLIWLKENGHLKEGSNK